MKRGLFVVLLLGVWASASYTTAQGNVSGKIFANLHHSMYGFDEPRTAFEIKRAYLGYTNDFLENFSAFVKIDIGGPEDVNVNFDSDDDLDVSLKRRFAYFKNAGLKYTKDDWELQFGLISSAQIKVQEKFWGKRYLRKIYQDEYSFTPSADIGVAAKRRINDWLSADIIITNGEGYSYIQLDNVYKYGGGLTITPYDFTIRLVADVSPGDVVEATYGGFLGYRKEKFMIAAEYNYKDNVGFMQDAHLFGYSVFAEYFHNDKLSFFGRMDQIDSSTLPGEDEPWRLGKDETNITAGLQYILNKNITSSLTYQGESYASGSDARGFVYLNVELNF